MSRVGRSGSASVHQVGAEFNPGIRAALVEGPGTYYLGIIDILQQYTWDKKLEQWFKRYVLCKPAAGLSCMPVDQYAKRFQLRVARQIMDNYH